ncbi:uncharacterized protein LOC115674504 [Syzygium oleosum]|uniref:uncharacterized protein LOC115674504 n=1 Tax=Syzygium oleosum TaxID=219896 RepID=UPI0024B8BE8E|nr:uncharacterized protein LOC115674504 [Syzygium oleosum]
MANSDAASSLGGEYQVFLNFRGPDTRNGFTDFLYHDLIDVGVRVFRDDDELRVGQEIYENLLGAINNSIIYIPIFSRTYAFSKWCLWELAQIVDKVSKSEGEKCILPIFLDVEPEDVKLKTPQYEVALLEHEKQFPDEVRVWRAALAAVGKIKGLNVKSSQAEIVESVVEKVLEKLEIKQKSLTEHLVGLDDRVKDLTEFLDVNHGDVRLLGIYGMGGIGKTTFAKFIFNQLYCHFGKHCSFLEDIRKSSSSDEDTVQLQKKLLSHIVGSGSVEQFMDIEQGKKRIGETLSKHKFLVVLDDVDKKKLVKELLGNSKLHRGSRIIITTRDIDILQDEVFDTQQDDDKKVLGNSKLYRESRIIFTIRDNDILQDEEFDTLQDEGFDTLQDEGFDTLQDPEGSVTLQDEGSKVKIKRYEMQMMDDGLALRLFCRHAFYKDCPSDDYRELSIEIVSLLGGLPLTIGVVGSLLKGEEKAFWEETSVRLRKVPEEKTLEKLRISYDNLDKYQQQIFLDIACFFFNEKKTDAIYIWDDCQYYPIRGIKVLTERCLIKILDNDNFWMHDQLIALGRQIVREDGQDDLGKNSRFWIVEEALHIIGTIKRKREVQGLKRVPFEITNEEFERLQNLKLLKLYKGTYAGDFAKCRSNLIWFSWHSPWDFTADKLYLDRLVVCKLNDIDFKDDSKAWDLIKRSQDLKVLSITQCSGITTIPDISKCSGLERLTLAQCSSLKRIESFIGNLQSLIELNIERCCNFIYLPKEVGALVKLKHFSLDGCTSLRELPSSLGNLASLIELRLSDTNIRELNFIGKLKSSQILLCQNVGWKDHDWQYPSNISTLVNIEKLYLTRCSEISEIPIGIGELSSLRTLELNETSICGIPRTINKLRHLQELYLRECHDIHELPELPTSLTSLYLHSISLISIPNLSNLTNLVELYLSDGSCITGKSNLIIGCNLRGIERLSRLKRLELHLLNVPAPPKLASLSHLEKLTLSALDLKSLMQRPSSYWILRNLLELDIFSCGMEDIPLDGLPLLRCFNVRNCKRLQRLLIPLELMKLHQVDVSGCPELVQIQVMGLLKSLEILIIGYCESLTNIGGLLYLKNLETLKIEWCNVLANVEGLNELESLKYLDVKECPSLKRLIDASRTNIPDDCRVQIEGCGDLIKDSLWIDTCSTSMKRYKDVILLDTSNKVDNDSKGDFEGEVMETSREEWMVNNHVYSDEEWVEWLVSDPDEDPESAYVGESEIDSTSFVDDFQSESSNANSFEATGNRRQMRDARIGHYGSVDGGKPVCMGDRKKDKDEIREVANQNNVVQSSCQRCEGVEHFERSCKVTTEVEDQRDLSSVDNESDGEYEGEVMEMSREEWMTNYCLYSDEEWAKLRVSDPDEDLESAYVGESEVDGTCFVDDFQSESSNADSFEATGNRRQMRDTRMGHYGSVDGGKPACMGDRKKDNDEIREVANQNNVVQSSCQRCEGVEHFERSCKVTTEVEDQRDLSSIKHPFTIIFVLGVKKNSEGYGFVGGIERENKNVTPGSVTYEGLIADVEGFNFRLERMWYKAPGQDGVLLIEIKSDEQVNGMVPLASKRGFVHLYVEGAFDSEPSNAECSEATANRRQTRDERTGHDGIVNGGKMASMENRNKDKDMIGEPANKNDILRSRCQRGNGVEHYERSCKATTQVEDQRGLYSTEGGERATAWRTGIACCKKEKDGAEFDISGSNEVRDSASMGESETDGTSSIDDFHSEPGNIECFEATGNRRQMRDERIGRYDSVDGGKTVSMENRKKDKDEIGEPANPSDVVGSSGQTCKGVEHYERSCKATTEVEDQRDFSSVKRDKTVETDQVLAKTGRGSATGCASKPGRDPTERGRGKDIAKSSRNGKGLRLGRDVTSTLGKGTTSNSGRDIASGSRSSATSSSRRARGSTSGKGTTLSSGRGMTLSLGTGGGSSSRMDTTKMGIASSLGRGTTSSSRSSRTLSTERGRDSTSGKGTTVSSGRGMTLSLGTGRGSSSRMDTTKMGIASSLGGGITSSSQSSGTLSTERGRDSTSGQGTTVSSGRGMTLSLGTGRGSGSRMDTTKMGTASSPGRGITSSSRIRVTLSMGRGRGSTSGKGTTVSSGSGETLSLGTGRGSSSIMDTNKMRTASSPGRGIISSSRSSVTSSTRRGRGSTSGKGTTISSERGTTLSLGRGTTKLGTSLRLGTYKSSSSAKAEPQTSRSREEQ